MSGPGRSSHTGGPPAGDSTEGPATEAGVRAEKQVADKRQGEGSDPGLPQASKVRSFQAGGMTTPGMERALRRVVELMLTYGL